MDASQNFLFRLISKAIGIDMVIMAEDTAYILKRQDHNGELEERVKQLKQRYKNSFIMGGSFGLALLFSLRRYFPSYFAQFSLNRLFIEITILGGTLMGSTLSVILGGAKIVHELKRNYIIKADVDYYRQMNVISERYQLDQQSQVRFTLNPDEFQQWKKYRMNSSIDPNLRI